MGDSACKTCEAPIIWAKTKAGRSIPLNAEADPLGNLYLDEEGVAQVVTKDLGRSVDRYTTHFATCPQADAHRLPRGVSEEPVVGEIPEQPKPAEPDPESEDPYLWGSGT